MTRSILTIDPSAPNINLRVDYIENEGWTAFVSGDIHFQVQKLDLNEVLQITLDTISFYVKQRLMDPSTSG